MAAAVQADIEKTKSETQENAADAQKTMAEIQKINIPRGICQQLPDESYNALYNATIIHDKPLTNALGPDYKNILSFKKIIDTFKNM